MASTRLDDLTPDTKARAEALIRQAAADGIELRVVSTRRTCADQNSIYAQGRTAPGAIVTKARGCMSWHVWGRAVDFLVMDNGKAVSGADSRYDRMGELAKGLGMIWGGDFSWGRDAGHVEYHPGVSIQQVCPDPDSCEYSLKQPWPVTEQPAPVDTTTEPTSQPPDLVSTSRVVQKSASVGTVMFVGAAILGAGYLAVLATQRLKGIST